ESAMRFVVTPIIALVLTLGPSSGQASAVVGYDSEYAGESAFLNIAPGPPQPFQVFFKNTGTATCQKNPASKVNLAICHAVKAAGSCARGSECQQRIFGRLHYRDRVGVGGLAQGGLGMASVEATVDRLHRQVVIFREHPTRTPELTQGD